MLYYVLQDESIVYATFTTAENSIPGTAVCSFNVSSIEDAFQGKAWMCRERERERKKQR